MANSKVEAAGLEGEVAFARLSSALDAHPGVSFHGEGSEPWDSRHVYWHLHRWHEWTTAALATTAAKGAMVDPYQNEEEMHGLNDRWAREAGELTVAASKAACLASRQDMRAAYERLDDDDWDAYGRAYAAEFSGRHYLGHLADLPEALRSG